MQYLLDTHVLIWFQEANPKIRPQAMQEIQNPANDIFYSQISLFEIAIKQSIGKLPGFLASIADVQRQALNDGFSFLPIQNNHIEAYRQIPLHVHHRDPFDRLLISTAQLENLTVMTADANFKLYPGFINVLWT